MSKLIQIAPIVLLFAGLIHMPAEAGKVEGGSQLYGVSYDTGDVYGISVGDASLSLIASTGLQTLGSLEMAPDGTYYGFTTTGGGTPTLYNFDPISSAPTAIGPLTDQIVFDGSIVFSPGGTVYGTNRGALSSALLFTVDTNSGATDVVGFIDVDGDIRHDVNGMAWRDDGVLVGLDRETQSLLAIDPTTAVATVISSLDVDLGTVGGMTILDGVGYFTTAGPGSLVPGSNSLYSFDLYTGAYELVGSFDGVIDGVGFGGLAVVPEPATAVLVLGGIAALLRRRRS